MQLSRALNGLDGIDRASVMMGTPANKELLRADGLGTADLDRARPTDLLIVADAADAATGQALGAKVDEFLRSHAAALRGSRLRSARSLGRAMKILGDANLALVPIPGEYVSSKVHALLD